MVLRIQKTSRGKNDMTKCKENLEEIVLAIDEDGGD